MIKVIKLLIAILLSTGFCQSLFAESYSIIVHPSNHAQFDAGIVERIFLSKQKTFSNGKPATALHMNKKAPSRQAFIDTFIGRTDSQIQSYWAMLIFSSRGQPPKDVNTYQAMLELVSSNPDLIGYVPTSLVSSQVRAVIEFDM